MVLLCPAGNTNCRRGEDGGICGDCGFDFEAEHLTAESLEVAKQEAATRVRQRTEELEKAQQAERELALQDELALLKRQMAELLEQTGERNREVDALKSQLAEEARQREVEARRKEEEAKTRREAEAQAKLEAGCKAAQERVRYCAGEVFRDTLEDGSLGPEMVVIPAGEFLMGSDDGDADEQPIHTVKIARPFALGKYPVTQKEWRKVMGDNPSHFKGCDDCPVEQVSWEDVQIFIKRLNHQTGETYRLPSEAEWEYAAKAGGNFRYAGSDDFDAVAWCASSFFNMFFGRGKKTHPVGQKQANAWGLYDMSGNVWEWVEDCWNASYQGAPTDGSVWTTGESGRRVLRGGSWNFSPYYARAAIRSRVDSTNRINSIGFRLARMLP